MKTFVMLVPNLGKSVSPEIKESIIRCLGVVNLDRSSMEDMTIPLVEYKGRLFEDQKRDLENYLEDKITKENIAILYIECEKDSYDDVCTLVVKGEQTTGTI